jgi:hypothetical protein
MGTTELKRKEEMMKILKNKNSGGSRNAAILLALLAGVLFLIPACEINDPVGDISRPGFMAASVYWDVPSTNVTAGNEVQFYAEYWSADQTFTSLGVWYDVVRKLKYSLTYPGNGFAFLLDSTEMVRESMEIKAFTHSGGNFDTNKKAFVIEDKFPVSYTLSSLELKNPLNFDPVQFGSLVPASIRERFIKSLFPQLGYTDFKALLVTENAVVPADTLETWFDTVTVDDVMTRQVKQTAIPLLNSKIRQLPFSSLIYNKNRQYYAVEFTRSFELNARFRVVNGNQVENFSDVKKITVF